TVRSVPFLNNDVVASCFPDCRHLARRLCAGLDPGARRMQRRRAHGGLESVAPRGLFGRPILLPRAPPFFPPMRSSRSREVPRKSLDVPENLPKKGPRQVALGQLT